jgi:hypothetical protein
MSLLASSERESQTPMMIAFKIGRAKFAGPLLALSLSRQIILPASSISVKPHLFSQRHSVIQYFLFSQASSSLPSFFSTYIVRCQTTPG